MRYQYSCTLHALRSSTTVDVQRALRASAPPEQTHEQHAAWDETVEVLWRELSNSSHQGQVYFEFAIPRLGARIDVVLIIRHVVFVLEFKTGSGNTSASALDQVTDYALDLRYFHQPSHSAVIAPFLITGSRGVSSTIALDDRDPLMTAVAVVSPAELGRAIDAVLELIPGRELEPERWVSGVYEPTLWVLAG